MCQGVLRASSILTHWTWLGTYKVGTLMVFILNMQKTSTEWSNCLSGHTAGNCLGWIWTQLDAWFPKVLTGTGGGWYGITCGFMKISGRGNFWFAFKGDFSKQGGEGNPGRGDNLSLGSNTRLSGNESERGRKVANAIFQLFVFRWGISS